MSRLLRVRSCVLSAGLLALALSAPAAAQYEFDYITADHLAVDPDAALGFSTQWGILVNTGSVPIPLDEWGGGLSYAESSQPIGFFSYRLVTPFGPGVLLQPGEAIGNLDPLLVAKLRPGEILAYPSSAQIAHFQIDQPYPQNGFGIDVFAQVGDRVARTRTKVTLGHLSGSSHALLSAERVSAEPSALAIESVGDGCGFAYLAGSGDLEIVPGGCLPTAQGPPWIASGSNLPKIGNQNFCIGFGQDFGGPAASPGFSLPWILAVDTAPGSAIFAGCDLLVGFTPQMFTFSGVLDEYLGGPAALPIPDNLALIGLQVWIQGLVLTASAENGIFASSNALAVTIGEVAGTLP